MNKEASFMTNALALRQLNIRRWKRHKTISWGFICPPQRIKKEKRNRMDERFRSSGHRMQCTSPGIIFEYILNGCCIRLNERSFHDSLSKGSASSLEQWAEPMTARSLCPCLHFAAVTAACSVCLQVLSMSSIRRDSCHGPLYYTSHLT